MKIVEIFDSIDGEGIRTGQPATFIRLAGCNLRCSYCDTAYALFGEDEPCVYEEMTVDEVVNKVNPNYRRVTLTGGEPLISPEAAGLVTRLIENGVEVNIETNGAVDIAEFLKSVPDSDRLFFTIDYKLPSSGVCDKMIWRNFENLRTRDVIKFVVGSDEDVSEMKSVMNRITPLYETMPHIFVGAVYGKFDAQKLVNIILSEPLLKDARFQVQLHKIIWDPNERGV